MPKHAKFSLIFIFVLIFSSCLNSKAQDDIPAQESLNLKKIMTSLQTNYPSHDNSDLLLNGIANYKSTSIEQKLDVSFNFNKNKSFCKINNQKINSIVIENNSFKTLSNIENLVNLDILKPLEDVFRAQYIFYKGFNNVSDILIVGENKFHDKNIYIVQDSFTTGNKVNLFIDKQSLKILALYFMDSNNCVLCSDFNDHNYPINFTIDSSTGKFTTIIQDYISELKNNNNQIIIPFEFYDNKIIFECTLNGSIKTKAAFATSLSKSIIDTKFAYQNNLIKQLSPDNYSVKLIIVDKLKINDTELNNFNFDLVSLNDDLQQNDTNIIFGLDIFEKSNLLIDYKKKILIFNSTDNSFPTQFKWSSQIPSIDLLVKDSNNNDIKINANIDTGAKFNYISNLPQNLDNNQLYSSQIQAYDPNNQLVQMTNLILKKPTLDQITLPYIYFAYPNKTTNSNNNKAILSNSFLQNFKILLDPQSKTINLKLDLLESDFDKLIRLGNEKLYFDRDYRQSEDYYQKALIKAGKNNYQNIQSLERLGNLRRVMGHDLNRPIHYKTSYILLTKALDMAKFYKYRNLMGEICSDLAVLYLNKEQMNEVTPLMNKALQLAPENFNVLVNVSLIQIKLNKFNLASKNLNQVLFYNPSNWEALWFLYSIAQKTNYIQQKKQILNTILFFYPWSKLAKKLLDSNSNSSDNLSKQKNENK